MVPTRNDAKIFLTSCIPSAPESGTLCPRETGGGTPIVMLQRSSEGALRFPSVFEIREIKSYIMPLSSTTRKGARVVESAGLENRNTASRYRGFESLPFRQSAIPYRCCGIARSRLGASFSSLQACYPGIESNLSFSSRTA